MVTSTSLVGFVDKIDSVGVGTFILVENTEVVQPSALILKDTHRELAFSLAVKMPTFCIGTDSLVWLLPPASRQQKP